MSMSKRKKMDDAGRAQPGLPGEARQASSRAASARRYGPDERRALLAAYAASGQTMQSFCVEHRVSTATLCAWRRAVAANGEQGLVPRPSKRNARGVTGPARSPEERRAVVEAFQRGPDAARLRAHVGCLGVDAAQLAHALQARRAGGLGAQTPRPAEGQRRFSHADSRGAGRDRRSAARG